MNPEESLLGKPAPYVDHYDASLLFPISRLPKRVELLQPLGVIPIRLASRHGLDMLRIHQIGPNAVLFEQLINRDPVHPSRFHRDGIYATLQQPGHQGMKIGRKGPKHPHRLRVTIGGHRHNNLLAADIETSCVRMDTGEILQSLLGTTST